MLKIVQTIAVVSFALLAPTAAFAADLALPKENVYFSNIKPLAGEIVRIYATVKNQSQQDVRAQVTFTVEGTQVGGFQPVTVLAGQSSTVFVDWGPKEGYYDISVSVVNPDAGDENFENNTAEITDFVVDLDTDKDNIFDTVDIDDDNDGVEDGLERIKGSNPLKPDTDNDGANDGLDEFPLDPNEKYDNDKEGIGNNADPDNDNDGAANGDDPAPFDPLTTGKEHPQAPEPLPAPQAEQAEQEPEYAVEEVTYTFPDASEAAYALSVSIAKSRTDWNTYEFDVLGADPSFVYLWDFGDQTYSQEPSPGHSFPGSGEYAVTLSVSDADRGLGVAEERISIGFWNIGNLAVQLVIGSLGLAAALLAGYLGYQAFGRGLFQKNRA